MQPTFITLKNNFLKATITNYGARLTGAIINNKLGEPVDVVAGFATIDAYLNATAPYYGATIGRFANRIANGKFKLNGCEYHLPVNNGPNSLHGGSGFHDKVWDIIEADEQHILMQYFSVDGEDGYPGDLQVQVKYSLSDGGLLINYKAVCDADTIINLTNHAYFNLNGEGSGSIADHTIQINAAAFTPVNEKLIPTGELAAVGDSPFDLRQPKSIAAGLGDSHHQITIAHGYDHNYVLNKTGEDELAFAAKATGDKTGIYLEVFTTEPGLQFYSGNFMDGTNKFKGGAKDAFRSAFALETQHFPDSPNHLNFPSTVLRAHTTFASSSLYCFGLE